MATPQETPRFPIFELELLRSMRDTMQEQNRVLVDLRDVLRDLRDELEYARIERSNGSGRKP